MSDEVTEDEEDHEDDDDKKDHSTKLVYSYPLGPKYKKGTRRK